MRFFKVVVRTNSVGSECSDVTEVEDDATEEEIKEAVRATAMEMLEYWSVEVTSIEGDIEVESESEDE